MIAAQKIAQEEKDVVDRFDLRSKLRFNQETGKIWLGESRLLLLHAKALMELRTKLFDYLDDDTVKRLLIRIGFVAGEQDADLAHKLADNINSYDVFRIGPELHAFEGHVRSHITEAEIDWETGRFFGEVIVENSWEAEAQLQSMGLSDDPACWTIIGYASGYTSRFFRRFIVFKETQCMCTGDHHCKFVGKPADCWDDESYIDLFRDDPLNPSLRQIEKELSQLRGKRQANYDTDGLVGASPEFTSALNLLKRAADSPINVLLLGETGVGKEVFARWLHEHSGRKENAFIAVNCGAIPHELIEAELFGVKKGAFTGAQESRPGRFERADGGTLFLDELGDLPLSAQVKLLRVLQSGEVERLGDDVVRKVNVRLVAATNVDLQKAIKEGKFRADLYYRIATYPVSIPPLRDRRADILLLCNAMIDKFSQSYQKRLSGLSEQAMQVLRLYDWPGNVRELENVIERGVLLATEGGLIELEHLFVSPPDIDVDIEHHSVSKVNDKGLIQPLSCEDPQSDQYYDGLIEQDEFNLHKHEQQIFEAAVRKANGNLTHAAQYLGVTRRQLAYRINEKPR
ncbi:AAA family ATPase [Aestuariibacter sp. GS-14]|uniref:sigma-54-dependent Fis family transcriptional regulator n=1 Tax=Aestuariibacter sp. GS-14 TaxID=2590670 RepID=UPI00112C2D83|nr:sigma-54-dependent Fis family transcriptional regulator [Aestuariibacter sp. GS-14]TPV61945.1 AAA family ATPase [Aestuariibacter sp. GS-14]